jgi:hypothetical protein
MPALTLSSSKSDRFGVTSPGTRTVAMHLSPMAAAELERLCGGRTGLITTAQRPALDALRQCRAHESDLYELVRFVDRAGEVRFQFL